MYLEELGYLEKTHISSGRIPSELGYRYYVENLMKPKEITGEDVLKLQTILNNNTSLCTTRSINRSIYNYFSIFYINDIIIILTLIPSII